MNARILPFLRLLLTCFLIPVSAFAQGFAGLGQGGDGFALPQPGTQFEFPRDHGAHPDYRIEWWYLTAVLKDEAGRDYGIQWTLFRSALAPGGAQVWMGHVGVTTPEHHYSGERLARGDVGQAGVAAEPFAAWIDDWSLTGRPGLDSLRVEAQTAEAGYDLALQATGPLVFHGKDGFSVKSNSGQASFYYSQPFLEVTGSISLPEGEVLVTGQAWLDREWSSQPLESDQTGWDWFSLHLADGARLMAFQLRGGTPFTYASWISPEGDLTPVVGELELAPLRQTQAAGRQVPTHWRLRLPSKGLDIKVDAVNPESWQDTLFPYWEGPVLATGSHQGRGYLEMTGYEE